ncbi:MAG: carbohydrate kinase family protein [Actinobacteria bacterium]|nr:carbohydrate kinase family protein [Actinomycetota bacterium]
MSIVVTGSIAYDNIMDFPGYFKDHILPEKVHILSVSFLVESLKKQRGGAAANVAYNLALLGEAPRLLGAVGDDFEDYRGWLEGAGVDTSPVRVVVGEFTASAFITTDRDDNQITGFYPGAMSQASDLSVKDVGDATLVVITPDDPRAMAKYPAECRSSGVPYIYSPGQQIVSLSPEQLSDGVAGALCVIGNDYEMEMIESKTGLTQSDLLGMAEIVITTLGDRGSRIATSGGTVDIPAVAPTMLVDPTGAGDAYLAGIARGIARGDSPQDYGRVGALSASQAIAEYGTQAHHYEPKEFSALCEKHFGEDLISRTR